MADETLTLRTVNYTAEKTGMSPHTIRSWIAKRRLRIVRLGRSVRIPQTEIARLIERGTVPARPDAWQ